MLGLENDLAVRKARRLGITHGKSDNYHELQYQPTPFVPAVIDNQLGEARIEKSYATRRAYQDGYNQGWAKAGRKGK